MSLKIGYNPMISVDSYDIAVYKFFVKKKSFDTPLQIKSEDLYNGEVF